MTDGRPIDKVRGCMWRGIQTSEIPTQRKIILDELESYSIRRTFFGLGQQEVEVCK